MPKTRTRGQRGPSLATTRRKQKAKPDVSSAASRWTRRHVTEAATPAGAERALRRARAPVHDGPEFNCSEPIYWMRAATKEGRDLAHADRILGGRLREVLRYSHHDLMWLSETLHDFAVGRRLMGPAALPPQLTRRTP